MDIYNEWGHPWQLTADGDIQSATGWDEVRQQLERLLLSNPSKVNANGKYLEGDCVFAPSYGLGLRSSIGSLSSTEVIQQMQSKCLTAVLSNPNIKATPAPIVSLTGDQHKWSLYIFVYLNDNTPGLISLGDSG